MLLRWTYEHANICQSSVSIEVMGRRVDSLGWDRMDDPSNRGKNRLRAWMGLFNFPVPCWRRGASSVRRFS